MAWSLVFLAVLCYCTGVLSQATLTQPASLSVSLGQTAKLPCTRSSAGSWNDYYGWYQQKPGQAPRFVLYFYSSSSTGRGDGIPDRFAGSVSGTTGYLTISNVQDEDEAGYYCSNWYSTGRYVFGGGTHMFVTGQPEAPPTVFLYPPSPEEIKSRSKATLVCLVNGFHPGVVTVSWTVDGTPITSGVETTKPTKQGDKYLASSYLTLNDSEYNSHDTYICKVTHEGKPYEKSVKRSECS